MARWEIVRFTAQAEGGAGIVWDFFFLRGAFWKQ